MTRHLCIISGWLAFGTGCIGAFLPILPTTPFMLLAAYFFSKGSPDLHAWILRRPGIGPVIQDWETHGSISLRAKCTSSVLMILLLSYPILFKPYTLALKLSLILVAGGVMAFVWSRPTATAGKSLFATEVDPSPR